MIDRLMTACALYLGRHPDAAFVCAAVTAFVVLALAWGPLWGLVDIVRDRRRGPAIEPDQQRMYLVLLTIAASGHLRHDRTDHTWLIGGSTLLPEPGVSDELDDLSWLGWITSALADNLAELTPAVLTDRGRRALQLADGGWHGEGRELGALRRQSARDARQREREQLADGEHRSAA
jgi:hypothetical protein